jgi:hypothetical protein
MLYLVFVGLLFLIVLVGTLAYLAYLVEFIISRRPGRVIYHGSDLGEQGILLQNIIKKYVPATEAYSLVEPGAGLGKVAEYLGKKFAWKEVIAVELGPVILTFGKIRAWFFRTKLTFVHQNIFAYAMPKKAVVYCYLTSDLLDELYIKKQLNNRLVISLTFPLTGVNPTEEIALKGWQSRLLVYDFRK